MSDTRFCAACGAQTPTAARFCPSCGADQSAFEVVRDEPAAAEPASSPAPESPAPPSESPAPPSQDPAPPPPATPAPESPTQHQPGTASAEPSGPQSPKPARPGATAAPPRGGGEAGELAGHLVAGLRAPGLVAAGTAAAVGSLVTLVAAILLAIAFPDDSLIGSVRAGSGVVSETFRQVVQVLLAGVYDPLQAGGFTRLGPAALALVPIFGSALGARLAAPKTAGMRPLARLAWGAGTAIPFAVLMTFAAIAAGSDGPVQPSVGAAFALGLLWGLVGGVAGTVPALGATATWGAGRAAPLLDAAGRAMRPLLILLVLGAVLGSAGWLYATAAGTSNVRADRSETVAVVENGLYAVEHGTHLVQLGSLTSFEAPGSTGALGLPAPAASPREVSTGDSFRVFAYKDAVPVYLFLPLLLLAIALTALSALYAGFSVARGRGLADPARAAAWGAVVGPLWAVSIALLNSLIDKPVFGQADSGSAFWSMLIVGAGIGALGGLLAARGTNRPST